MEKRLLIVGAGRIGRGFLAHLFLRAGWTVTFVERSEPLAVELRRRGQYTLSLADDQGRVERISLSGYSTLSSGQGEEIAAEIERADLLAVAVKPSDLAAAAALLAPGLRRRLSRQAVNLILCGNAPGGASLVRRELELSSGDRSADPSGWKRLGILESIVIRVIPDPQPGPGSPLDLLAGDYPELYVDGDAAVGPLPEVPGLVAQGRFAARWLRKLYTYNLTHALLGFWGRAEGYDTVTDSFRDPWIRRQAERALEEAGAGLMGEFGFSPQEMEQWNAGVRRLMSNPHIGDRLERLVHDPLRKLAREERLTGAALLALKHGVEPRALCRVIAYVLHSLGMAADQARQACQLRDEESALEGLIARAHAWVARERAAARLGFEFEKTYKGCGQSVFAAVQQALGREEDRVFQALTPFAGGLGLSGDSICATLVGGGACFGLARGRRRSHFDGDREPKYTAFAMAQDLRERFLWKYGSLLCRGAQEKVFGRSFDLRSPQEREAFERAGAHVDKCPAVVADVARWSVQILGEHAPEV